MLRCTHERRPGPPTPAGYRVAALFCQRPSRAKPRGRVPHRPFALRWCGVHGSDLWRCSVSDRTRDWVALAIVAAIVAVTVVFVALIHYGMA